MGANDIISMILCAAAIVSAAHFPMGERLSAIICAASLLANAMVYMATWYADYSPALALDVKAYDLWAINDLACGALALWLARDWWWGRMLYGTFFIEAVAHSLRWDKHLIGHDFYYNLLDTCFYGQGAIFLAIGGPRCGQLVLDYLASLGGGSRKNRVPQMARTRGSR